jgi:hypothetical protein
MKLRVVLLVFMLGLSGCSQFRSILTELFPDEPDKLCVLQMPYWIYTNEQELFPTAREHRYFMRGMAEALYENLPIGEDVALVAPLEIDRPANLCGNRKFGYIPADFHYRPCLMAWVKKSLKSRGLCHKTPDIVITGAEVERGVDEPIIITPIYIRYEKKDVRESESFSVPAPLEKKIVLKKFRELGYEVGQRISGNLRQEVKFSSGCTNRKRWQTDDLDDNFVWCENP